MLRVQIAKRDMGEFVNAYVVTSGEKANSIAGSLCWDKDQFDLVEFKVNPLLLSTDGAGNMQTARWFMLNDKVKEDGFLAFLIGATQLFELEAGAIALGLFRKKQTGANMDTIQASEGYPIRWSAAKKTAEPIPIELV